MAGGRAGAPGASYDRTMREQESQKDRAARLDRQRLRENHLNTLSQAINKKSFRQIKFCFLIYVYLFIIFYQLWF